MPLPVTESLVRKLRSKGVGIALQAGSTISERAIFEPPCSVQWISTENDFSMGAFSYGVNGYYSNVTMGRYCSIGEAVNIGRSNHPLSWISTSPFFYLDRPFMDVGRDFPDGDAFHRYAAPIRPGTNVPQPGTITIGNDVWIGHGAFIRPGVTIGDGAVIGGMSVVMSDVPPYGVVAGNPATLRRFRLPTRIIERLLELRWWEFAPWQLSPVDFTIPELAVDQLQDVVQTVESYKPLLVYVRDQT